MAVAVRSMGGRTRTDKIGVGPGGDISGTDISCNLTARQYTGPTGRCYQDDDRHVDVMPTTPSTNTPDWCAEQVRTRLPCDLTFCEKIGACCFVRLCNRSFVCCIV